MSRRARARVVTLKMVGKDEGLNQALRDSLKHLKQNQKQVRNNSVANRDLASSSRASGQALQGSGNSAQRSGRAHQQYERWVRQSAESSRRFGKDLRGVRNELSDVEKRVLASVASFQQFQRRAMGAFVVLEGAERLIGTLRDLNQVSTEYGDRLKQVSVISGEAGSGLADLDRLAQQLGASTSRTASEVLTSMVAMARAGKSPAEILGSYRHSLNLANVDQIGLSESASVVDGALSAFGLTVGDTERVVDAFTIASTGARTDVLQLGFGMSKAGSLAASFGRDLEEVLAIIGVLGDRNIGADIAGTSLKTIMLSLASPRETVLRELQLTAEQLDPAVNRLEDIFRRLAEAGMTPQQAEDLFGREAVASALVLLDESILGKVDDLTYRMQSQRGVTADLAAEMENTLGGAFRSLDSATEALSLTFGRSAEPAVREFVEALTQGTRDSEELAAALGRSLGFSLRGLLEALPLVSAAFKGLAVGATTYAVSTLTVGLINLARGAPAAAAAMMSLNAVIAANPIGALAVTLGAAAAAAAYFEQQETAAEIATRQQHQTMSTAEEVLSRYRFGIDQASTSLLEHTQQLRNQTQEQLKLAEARLADLRVAAEAARLRERGGHGQNLDLALSQQAAKANKELAETEQNIRNMERLLEQLGDQEADINVQLEERGRLREQERQRLQDEEASRRRSVQVEQESNEAQRERLRLLQQQRDAQIDHFNEVADLEEEVKALRRGAEAYTDLMIAREAAQRAAAQGITSKEALEQLRQELVWRQDLIDLRDQLLNQQRQEQQPQGPGEVERLRAIAAAVRDATDAERERTIQQEIWNRLSSEGGEITAKRIAQIRAEVVELLRLRQVIDDTVQSQQDQERAAEEAAKSMVAPFEQAWQGAQGIVMSGWTDMLGSVAGMTDDSFGDIFDNVLDQFKALLVQMLAEWSAMELQKLAISTASGSTGSGIDGLLSTGASVSGVTGGSGAGAGLSAGAAAALWVGAFYLAIEAYSANNTAQQYGTAVGASVTNGRLNVDHAAGGLQDAANAVGDAIRQIEAAMGEAVDELPRIAIRAKNNGEKFKALVGNVLVGTFYSYEEALDAAVAEAFRQAGGNFSPQVQAALQSTAHSTIEGLLAHIETAVEHRDLGLPQVVADMREVDRILEDRIRRFKELGLSLDGAISAWGDSLAGLRDHIVGNQPDPFQERLDMVDPFNQELARREAELREDLARYLNLLDQLMGAGGEISGMSHRVFSDAVEAGDAISDAIDIVVRSIGAAGGAVSNRAADIQAMIDSILGQLNSLPDRIDPGEVRRNGNGQSMADVRDELDRLFSGLDPLNPTAAAFAEIAAQAERATELMGRLKGEELALAQARRDAAVAAAQARARAALDQRVQDFGRGQGPQTPFQSIEQLRGVYAGLVEETMAAGLSAEETASRLAELQAMLRDNIEAVFQDLRTGILSLDPVASAALGVEQQLANADLYKEYIASLNLSAERAASLLAAVEQGLENSRTQGVGNIVMDLLRGVDASRRFEQQRVEWAQALAELQFEIYKAQLQAWDAWDPAIIELWNAARDAAMETAAANQSGNRPQQGQAGPDLSQLSPIAAAKAEISAIQDRAEALRQEVRETTRTYTEAAASLADIDLGEAQALLLKEHGLVEELFRESEGLEEYESKRLELAHLALELKKAEYEIQFQMLGKLAEYQGLIDTWFEHQQEAIDSAITSANTSTVGGSVGGTIGGGSSDVVANATRLLDQLAALGNTFSSGPQDPGEQLNTALSTLGEIGEQLNGLKPQAALLGKFGVDLQAALDQLPEVREKLLDDFWNRELGTGESEPATLQDAAGDINDLFDRYRELALEHGGDLLRIEEERGRRLKALMEDITGDLRGLHDDLLSDTGQYGTNDPRQALAAAQSRYDDLRARAAAGDLEAYQQLRGAAEDVLSAGQAMWGGSGAFQALRQRLAAEIEPLLSVDLSTLQPQPASPQADPQADQLVAGVPPWLSQTADTTLARLLEQSQLFAKLLGDPARFSVPLPSPVPLPAPLPALPRVATAGAYMDFLPAPAPLPLQPLPAPLPSPAERRLELQNLELTAELRNVRSELAENRQQLQQLTSLVAELTHEVRRGRSNAEKQRDTQIQLQRDGQKAPAPRRRVTFQD